RYPRHKDSGVEWLDEVPEHWEVDRLKRSTAGAKNGVWGAEPQQDANDIPCIRVADFHRQKLRVSINEPTIRNVQESERAGRVLQRGDLLLEKSGGGDSQPVGCVVLYDGPVPAVCSNFVARVQVSRGMDPSFWCYLHAAMYTVRLNTRSIKQTSGIQNLDQQQYFDELVGFPPSDEQSQIASFLDRETAKLDALIAEQQRLIELLKEKRQAVVSHAVTKGLDLDAAMKSSSVEWLGEVPAHWECVRNKVVFKEVDERSTEDDGELLTVSHITGVTRRSEKEVNMFLAETLQGYKRCRVGDVVINTMWAWMGALGCSPHNGLVSPSYNVYRIRDDRLLSAEYYDYLCRIPSHRVAMKANSTGIWESRLRLYPDAFLSMRVALPPITEQHSIVDFLGAQTARFGSLLAEAERAITLLQERRTALISAAVTGRIDVRGLAEVA
ncbi:MAG TPA: restriction endonuclease subunit S, partial [Longimicrobiaceae bacterium]